MDDYINAFDNYKKTLDLKNDFADGYYSLAVCEENLILDIEEGALKLDEEGKLVKLEDKKKKKLTEAETAYISELKADAVKNYEQYLSLSENAPDKDAVRDRILELSAQ